MPESKWDRNERKWHDGEMKSKAMAIQHNTKTVWSLAVPVFKYTEQVGPCGVWGGVLFFHHIDVKEIDWLSKTLTVVDIDEESRKIAKPKSSMFLYALHHSPLLLWPHCFGRPEDATCYWWGRVGLTPHTPHPPFLTRQPPPTPHCSLPPPMGPKSVWPFSTQQIQATNISIFTRN